MKEETTKTSGEVLKRLKGALKKNNQKAVWLARELGYSDPWISQIMSGKRALTVNMLLKIAEKLKIDPTSLLPADEDKIPDISFEEYIRRIVKEEIEKIKNK